MEISLADLIDRLSIINNKIWHLEEKLRSGKEETLELDELGSRAITIRDLNKQRIAIKNEINRRFDKNNYFEEIKVSHLSE